MKVWDDVSKDTRHRRLSPIGATRWWVKDAVLRKVFGRFGDPAECLYIDLIVTLRELSNKVNLQPQVRVGQLVCRKPAEIPNYPHCPDISAHLPDNNSTVRVLANEWNGFAFSPLLCHKNIWRIWKNTHVTFLE